MLTYNVISDFLDRIGVTDFNFSDVKAGDLISFIDPDCSFNSIKNGILSFRPYRNKVVDNGVKFIEVVDTIYVDGLKTVVSYLFTEGDGGFGTIAKAMIKRIDCVINGELRSFLSSEDMRLYKDRFIAS